ncbi:MAG TPA: nucleotidyltransferase family protein [Terriglobales bacterium]|nr:nucleotidyltransferase family protein [Terriglobales bacterium]
MSRAPSFCGVILAAGESTRMGSDKALLSWPPGKAGIATNQTFLSATIATLNAINDMVIVVGGKNAEYLKPIVYAAGASLVQNRNPELGQFSSLQIGLQEVLNQGRDAAMVTLVDRPPPRVNTLRALHLAFEEAALHGKWAVVPEYNGKHGHPFLIGREMISAFLKADVTATARDIEHKNQGQIQYFPVDDPFVTFNVDTPQDYEALAENAPHGNSRE